MRGDLICVCETKRKGELFSPGTKSPQITKIYIWSPKIQISTNTTAYWDMTSHLLAALISSQFKSKGHKSSKTFIRLFKFLTADLHISPSVDNSC